MPISNLSLSLSLPLLSYLVSVPIFLSWTTLGQLAMVSTACNYTVSWLNWYPFWIFSNKSVTIYGINSRNTLLTGQYSYHILTILWKSMSKSGWQRWWFWSYPINFWNFDTIHVFGVREFIADISTELPCLGYLENPGKLPVQQVLGGTGDCVL